MVVVFSVRLHPERFNLHLHLLHHVNKKIECTGCVVNGKCLLCELLQFMLQALYHLDAADLGRVKLLSAAGSNFFFAICKWRMVIE